MGCDCDETDTTRAIREAERELATGLPIEFPGRPVVDLRGRASCCTAYVNHRKFPQGAGGGPPPILRMNLWAEVAGMRNFLASAFVPAGYNGPAIGAAGILADRFFVTGQATDTRLEAEFGLITSLGCAEPAIRVADELRCPPDAAPPAILERLELAPFQGEGPAGRFGYATGVGAAVVAIPLGAEVTEICMTVAAGGGTIAINDGAPIIQPGAPAALRDILLRPKGLISSTFCPTIITIAGAVATWYILYQL